MAELSRRRLLAGTGTVLAGGLAGCSTEEGENDGTTDGDGDGNGDDSGVETETGTETETETENGNDDSSASDGTILGDIRIENVDDGSHTVDVVVEFGDEIEHWSTHELESADGTELERDWTTEPGSFRVTARLDGDDPVQVDPETWNRAPCLELVVLVDRDGELTVLADADGEHCGDDDGDEDGSQPFDGGD
ncbi:hypothetical protein CHINAEXTREME_05465 [Halobiforma lacisalsi AJ5]|uniref:Uncharacterized protein n=1 Tax=Natronobacterium lacisalsi AJ5 TaxID=358396 RepID=M0LJE7_NATLA|nr:hypothetical protein [Halobiforma lacisalsi]APW97252.1 hypothetical protein CHINAEXTREME_05465 [Halobiforma lacisalsi AJ5]EMA33762.1 hypothetical protein C445_08739 [Halobiforma lacisalsi AJ5]